MQARVLARLLRQLALPDAVQQEGVGGGCISQAQRLTLSDGRQVFLKYHAQAPAGFFDAEAQGLAALSRNGGLPVPRVIAVCGQAIVLEWLEPGKPSQDYWETLGHGLADVHRETAPCFGFTTDTFCGLTLQRNPWTEDGHAFFAQFRLQSQADRARQAGYLEAEDLRRLLRICGQLPHWIPRQPASLVHGDLWSGNVHTGPTGEPVLIDPAVHYGWAEADMAMTRLFGGFPERFYRAYAEAGTLDAQWESRVPLYNLYHLLNHLNLFGRGYLGEVQTILRRFG
ncbi:fructosamine kinase family protein [Mangrovitalea sediminis]|uniref:fructosamine kinase family protein n=1 Tax=Mangrovitalea sediminis TaxID=1982043 RepID=UPI000BE5848E|nr:fructosamine kinase family protein [Mangrovitalea sediminis]